MWKNVRDLKVFILKNYDRIIRYSFSLRKSGIIGLYFILLGQRLSQRVHKVILTFVLKKT